MRLKPHTGRPACPATAGLCTQHPGTSTSPGWSFPSQRGGPYCSLNGPSRLVTSINSAAPRGSGLVIWLCITEEGWKILFFVVCKTLAVAQDNRPFPRGTKYRKVRRKGRDKETKMRMHGRQYLGCVCFIYVRGWWEPPSWNNDIPPGRWSWSILWTCSREECLGPRRAGEKHQGLNAGQKTDVEKEGWETGASVHSNATWLEGQVSEIFSDSKS